MKEKVAEKKEEKKEEDNTLSILNEKISILKSEVAENKLYLELCFIALLVLVFGYFKSDVGHATIASGSIFGKIMIGIAVILYFAIVYFFYSIIRFNHRNMDLIREKLNKLVEK